LGNFVLTRTSDKSFEIQIQTSIFKNGNNAGSGTIITSVAMKTNSSPIVEIKLMDYNSPNPYQSNL
jgi:hypothetical protein